MINKLNCLWDFKISQFFKEVMSKKYALVLIILLSMIIKICYVLTLKNDAGAFESVKDVGYEIADNLLNGKGYFMKYASLAPLYSFRPPLYPIFLFFIFSLFGKNPLIVRIIYIMLNTLTAYFTYKIGKKIFNHSVGIISSFIVLLYPPLIYLSGWLGPEAIVIFLLTLTVYLIFVSSEKPILKNLVLLSLLICLSSYCRSFSLGLTPFLILSYFINVKQNKIKRTLQIVLFIILFISPWLIRNFIIHKRIVFHTDIGLALYAANNPDVLTYGEADFYIDSVIVNSEKMGEIERDSYLLDKGLEFIKKNPGEYLKLVRLRLWRLWRPYFQIRQPSPFTKKQQVMMVLTEGPILLLFFAGLFLSFRRYKRKLLLFYLIFLYFTITSSLVRAKVSYRMSFSPFIILITSYSIWRIYSSVKFKRFLKNLKYGHSNK